MAVQGPGKASKITEKGGIQALSGHRHGGPAQLNCPNSLNACWKIRSGQDQKNK
jgi:hypothetical protein